METKSTSNGILEPRLYQVYGDRIDSKQAMEPLALATGTGPVTGFNAFSWDSQNRTVTFSSFNDLSHIWFNGPRETKDIGYKDSGGGDKTISDPSNIAGDPLNAHITRDGLLHTCHNITLPFTPSKGWPSVRLDGSPIDDTPSKGIWFGLKAKHEYIGQSHSVIDNPVTFEVFEVDLNPFSLISNGSYSTLCNNLKKKRKFNPNTETLIGFYIVGWDASWEQNEWSKYYKALMYDLSWCLSLVFYHSNMPHLAQTPFDLDRCRRITDKVEYLTSQSIGTIYIKLLYGTIEEFKLTHRDEEIDLTKSLVYKPSINVEINPDGSFSGYFTVSFTDQPTSLKIQLDTLVAQAFLKSPVGIPPRVELVNVYTDTYQPTLGSMEVTTHTLRFWADTEYNVVSGHNIVIQGILRMDDK